MFEICAVASGLTSKGQKVQCAAFLHVAGEEAIKVFNTFTFASPEDKDKLETRRISRYMLLANRRTDRLSFTHRRLRDRRRVTRVDIHPSQGQQGQIKSVLSAVILIHKLV